MTCIHDILVLSCPIELVILVQLLLHHRLGCDTRVVGPRHPEGSSPPHSVMPNQDVLQGVVERVPEMQGTGDVRRWNEHAEGRLNIIFGIRSAGAGPGVETP